MIFGEKNIRTNFFQGRLNRTPVNRRLVEFIQEMEIAEGISFSFLEFSYNVSLGRLGEYSNMFTNQLTDCGL